MKATYDAVAFDLLTALVDSWTLFASVTGDEARGREWRQASLRRVVAAGRYRDYEAILREAALETKLPASLADTLVARWGDLEPWPEVPGVLRQLEGRRLAVLTNCSQRLAEIAASVTGGRFEMVLSAERTGWYKTDPRAYRALVDALDLPAERIVFVAGSPHDVKGAPSAWLTVYWQNRGGLPVPPGIPPPLVNAPDLTGLLPLLGIRS